MSWYDLEPGARAAIVGLFGLFVGSFLNVAIHRLPREDMTVSSPRRSQCPSCARTLTWRENVPLLSWLAQRGRCRGCGWRIPWRYPLVELSTALLWGFAAHRLPAQDWPLLLLHLLVVAGLIVASAVDFACFEIPDEVSIGGMVLAPIASLALPRLHESSAIARALADGAPVGRFDALAACAAGMAAGGGTLLAIGWLGKRIYGRDAMGLGDVKLLCGAGGLLGPGGTFVALLFASLVASIAGVVNLIGLFALLRSRVRRRGGTRSWKRSWSAARVAGRYVPFGPYLAIGIGIVLLAWNDVRGWL